MGRINAFFKVKDALESSTSALFTATRARRGGDGAEVPLKLFAARDRLSRSLKTVLQLGEEVIND